MNDDLPSSVRPVLTSRERQALINRRETSWMRSLRELGIDTGHHPFLSAGDAEILEARFYERLRAGTPFEQDIAAERLPAIYKQLTEGALPERAVVTFCPDAETLGAFIATSDSVLRALEALLLRTKYELAVMSLDAADGLAFARVRYTEQGEFVPNGIVNLRAWGRFAPSA